MLLYVPGSRFCNVKNILTLWGSNQALSLQNRQGELQVCQSDKERAEHSVRRLRWQVGKVSEELTSLQQAYERKDSGLTNSEMRLSELQSEVAAQKANEVEMEAGSQFLEG